MNEFNKTIDAHFIRAPLSQAEKLGIDVPALLGELDISMDVFSQKNSVVHVDQYVRLMQRIWAIGGDEFSGLSREPCKSGHFAMLVRYVRHFDTLRAIVIETCRFYNSTRYDIALEYRITQDKVGVLFHFKDSSLDVDCFAREFLLVTTHRFFCWVTATRIPLLETLFDYSEPPHAYTYNELFPGKRTYNAEANGFYFDTKYLSLKQARDWEETKNFLINSPADLMVMPGGDESYGAQIKQLLQKELTKSSEMPDFDFVADQLSVSPQTLRRKLKSEEANFQTIKDGIRRDIAIDKLVREDLTIAEIAELVGFGESSSFTRAFKQWTGVSPGEYRLNRER